MRNPPEQVRQLFFLWRISTTERDLKICHHLSIPFGFLPRIPQNAVSFKHVGRGMCPSLLFRLYYFTLRHSATPRHLRQLPLQLLFSLFDRRKPTANNYHFFGHSSPSLSQCWPFHIPGSFLSIFQRFFFLVPSHLVFLSALFLP